MPESVSLTTGSSNLPESERLRGLGWLAAHNGLNAVFAYVTVFGPVFLLFMDELGLPKTQMGLLLALLPLSGVLALVTAAPTTRLGRKRVFVVCWVARKFAVAGLIALPWVLSRFGHTGGLVYLIVIVGLFSVMRATAEAAWYPWLQEVVPDRLRGRFAGLSSVVVTAGACLALGVAGQALRGTHGLGRFQWLIGAGCLVGLLAAAATAQVPGGAPEPDAAPPHQHLARMREALRDRNFMRYLGGLAGLTIGTMLYLTFLPLFLKQVLGVEAGTVVTLEAVIMIGGALASLGWGVAADRFGSRPVLMSAIAVTLLVPLAWLLFPRHGSHVVAWCGVLYLLHGIALGGVALGAYRLLLNDVMPLDQSTAYTAVHYSWMGLVGGVAPLLAGAMLQRWAGSQLVWEGVTVDGFALLFALAALCIAAGWACYSRVRPDDRYRTRDVLHAVSNRLLRRMPWRPPL